MRFSYYTEVDLLANDGPSVNESEFINFLHHNHGEYLLCITSEKNKEYCEKIGLKNVFYLKKYKLRSLIQNIISCLGLVKKIKKFNPNVFVCRLSDLPLLPFILKLTYRNQFLAIKTAALWYVDQKKSQGISDTIYNILNNFLITKLYKWADIIDTALINAREELVQKGFVLIDKIYLIDNGINTKKFTIKKITKNVPELKNKFPILGFMGSEPTNRGAKQALEVARRLKVNYPNIAVMILGNDKNLSSLLKEYEKSDIHIYSPGIVPYSGIDQYVRLMTIGFSFYEPWTVDKHGNASQKVRQYLACGKPVFSTFHGHEFLQRADLGAIFEHEDYEQMANDARKWIERINKEGNSLSQNIREYAKKHHSSEVTFKSRLNLYTKAYLEKSK